MNTNDFYKELMSEYSFDYEKIRKAADKSKSYSQFAEAEYPKRCRNTKRRVQKRTSVRS